MTELATRPFYSQGDVEFVDSEDTAILNGISISGEENPRPGDSLDRPSDAPSIISEDRNLADSSSSQIRAQEDDIPNTFHTHFSPTTAPDAIDLPDSEPDLSGLCKDRDSDCANVEKEKGKAGQMVEESYTNLLDTSKGFEEGRCKKVGQYLLGPTIGEGSYGKVRLATHLISKQKVAVKVVAKKTLVQNEAARRHFRREALMLQRLHHPHVNRLYQALETGNCYYLVFELAVGGSMLHVLSRHGTFSEQRSRQYMRQIVSALDHLHKSDIVHRDLKLENILLDEHSNVKLVDFGLSAVCQDSSTALSTQCGSPLYAAPELFAGRKYGKPVDVWSLGVCFYALLMGRLPFLPKEGASLLQLYSLILKGCEIPESLSPSCKELLTGMLEIHESRRLSLDEVLVHPWLTKSLSIARDLQPVVRVPPVPKQLNETSIDLGIVKYISTTFRFSERDVVTSVLGRKLTPAAATYHIIHHSIEAGRMSISPSREITGAGAWSNKEPKSAPANLSGKGTSASPNKKAVHALPSIQTANSNFVLKHEESKAIAQMNGQVESNDEIFRVKEANENFKQSSLDSTIGPRTICDLGDKEGACNSSDCPTRRTTSESTDSGVGVDSMSEETKTVAPEVAQLNPGQFSYKTFIMDLRQSRQKYKTNTGLKLNSPNVGVAGKGMIDGDQYVILGHSPRNRDPCDKDSIGEVHKSISTNAGNKQHTTLNLPALSASRSDSFSPTFPPIACAVSSPSSQSTSASSPVYSSISGLGQQCVKYNSFINGSSGSGGSFYYSSKPIPGFRHGNRYFLHLDKNNFTACNMGVMGIPPSTVEDGRLSCESFAPKFVANQTAISKAHNVRDTTFYPVVKPYSERIPPPPPNSNSCSPFSYLSGEKIELKAVGVHGNHMGPINQLQSPTLRLRTNNSSLQIHQLHTFSKNTNTERHSYSNSGPYNVYSHTEFNTDVDIQEVSRTTSTSAQHHRQPVRILASLRDLYGIDPWKKSKSQRTDLSNAVRKGQKNTQSGTQTCDISPTVRNPDFNNNRKEGSRRKRHSKSNKGDKGYEFSTMQLGVPDGEDGNESSSSSRPRSNVSTPIASEREDFMMPVTSVTIRTIGRP